MILIYDNKQPTATSTLSEIGGLLKNVQNSCKFKI